MTHSESSRLISIDILRAFAIFLVVGGHSRTGLPFPATPWIQSIWNQITIHSHMGVFIFFVVSGFLITRLIDRSPSGLFRPDLRWFYTRRVARILPLFLMALAVGILLYHLIGDPSNRDSYCFKDRNAPYGPWFWLSIPTCLFNWFLIVHPTQDFPRHWVLLWSLAVEEQFYIAYPLLLWRITTLPSLKKFLLVVLLFGCLTRWLGTAWGSTGHAFEDFSSFWGFGLIAFGSLLYLQARGRAPIFQTQARALGTALAGMAMVGSVILGAWEGFPLPFSDLILLAGLGLTFTGALDHPIQGNIVWAFFAEPGKLSYGIYLWHIFILYFTALPLKPYGWAIAFPAYLSVVLAWGFLSYHAYELPLNRRIRHTLGAHQPSSPTP